MNIAKGICSYTAYTATMSYGEGLKTGGIKSYCANLFLRQRHNKYCGCFALEFLSFMCLWQDMSLNHEKNVNYCCRAYIVLLCPRTSQGFHINMWIVKALLSFLWVVTVHQEIFFFSSTTHTNNVEFFCISPWHLLPHFPSWWGRVVALFFPQHKISAVCYCRKLF